MALTKKAYKNAAIDLYKRNNEAYNEMYFAIRLLVTLNLLEDSWIKFISDLDCVLCGRESLEIE